MNDWTNGISTLYRADAREIPLPDASVHMVVTSPPYWGLRDYGLGQWVGGDAECGHSREHDHQVSLRTSTISYARSTGHTEEPWPNGVCGLCGAVQGSAGIGSEATLVEWVQNIVAVMREVRRVLRDEGTVWLNLGDAYASSTKGTGGNSPKQDSHPGSFSPEPIRLNMEGLVAKNIMGQPWRAAFALQDDGWILRSAIVWHKPNAMPESATDRPTNAYEMIFLLSKQGRYFYDAEAVRVPSITGDTRRPYGSNGAWQMDGRPDAQKHGGQQRYNPTIGANARNVWTFPTQGRPDAHFATFPDELPRRCILAGTSEHGVCGECGAPWVRQVASTPMETKPSPKSAEAQLERGVGKDKGKTNMGGTVTKEPTRQTTGWQPTCGCNADVVPATVLDPFVGSGTTVAIAQSLGRRGVGLDLNSEYLENAAKRIGAVTLPLIAKGEIL